MRNETKSTPVPVETYLTCTSFNWYGPPPADLSPRAHLRDRPLNRHWEVDEMLEANDETNCPLTPPGLRLHFPAVKFGFLPPIWPSFQTDECLRAAGETVCSCRRGKTEQTDGGIA